MALDGEFVYPLSPPPLPPQFQQTAGQVAQIIFTIQALPVRCSVSRDESQVNLHYLKGALFENLVVNEFIKRKFHRGNDQQPYFWQDSQGREIDCLLVAGEVMTPVEIKAGKTLSTSYFDNFSYWQALPGAPQDRLCRYGGDRSLQTGAGALVSWRELAAIPS